ALVRLGLGPDPAAMAPCDARGDRQSHASALEALVAMQPLEQVEELVRVPHVETDAVVTDEIGLVGGAESDLDACLRARARVFERVGQQFCPQLHEHSLVALAA